MATGTAGAGVAVGALVCGGDSRWQADSAASDNNRISGRFIVGSLP
jgi:hypothetical protein